MTNYNEIFESLKVFCDESERINDETTLPKEETINSLNMLTNQIYGIIDNLNHDKPIDNDLDFMA